MLKYRKIGIGLFRVAGGEKSERGIGLACQKVFRYPQHNLFCLLELLAATFRKKSSEGVTTF